INVSIGANRNNFLVTQPREYPSLDRTTKGPAGDSKGGLPPLCRRGGGVHRGGTPSKGSRPYACFWVLFSRENRTSGSGGEAPEKIRSMLQHRLWRQRAGDRRSPPPGPQTLPAPG